MPRAAGNSGQYKWVRNGNTWELFDKFTETALPGVDDITLGEMLSFRSLEVPDELELPSVTTIIGDVLAKPALVGWAYRQTRDSISALVSAADFTGETDLQLMDILTDADCLDEWLKENGMRPDDLKDEAADRGKAEHTFLETLATLERHDANDLAFASHDDANPFTQSIAKWWTSVHPMEYRSEVVLHSLTHGFAGTADLVWKRFLPTEPWTMTDLKTRRHTLYAYDSDDIQTDGYTEGWNERHPTERIGNRTVLIAWDNGTKAKEYPGWWPNGSFLAVKAVWDLNQLAKANAKEAKARAKERK